MSRSYTIQDLEKLKAAGTIKGYNIPVQHSSAKKSKYGAKKTVVDGITFDSKKEATRYFELKLLQAAGEISELRLQVPYELSSCKYIADFVYLDKEGNEVVEDVKSSMTKKLPVYRLKKKMMKNELGIEIKEL